MVGLYGPRATNTWKLVKIGPFPSLRYSVMQYVGITTFFFRAILYAGHKLELFYSFISRTIFFPFYTEGTLCFSHFASQLYRHLGKNRLLDSPMERKGSMVISSFHQALMQTPK